MISVGGKKIPVGKDFDSNTGRLFKPDSFVLLDEPATKTLVERLRGKPAGVKSVEDKPYVERPYAPFTTSTLQQEANRKLGFTARATMSLAQSLYENGYITYMRTDSTNLSGEAINAARKHISTQYGKEYLPESPRIYKTNVKNAQEAHEAIRPAGSTFDLPEYVRGRVTFDEFRLYDLIWKRTVASQMADARGMRKQLVVALDDALFSVGGKTIDFPGYLRAYVEGSDDPEADIADREVLLPNVKAGDPLECRALEPKSHATSSPSRYSEAALTKVLTDKGIGRPSTYASIIETILNRNYVFKKNGALVPTWVAFAVCKLLEQHLPDLINYDFTAQMEDQLDAISRGELEHLQYLKDFYFGSEHPGLKKQLDHKVEEIDARDVSTVELGTPDDGESIVVRIGKFGPYIQQGERKGSIPDDLPPDELTIAKALEILDKSEQGDEPLGICPETGKPIFVKNGRFGPYIQRGTLDDADKPQNASLLKGMRPEDVDMETALKLLSLPRKLGVRPGDGEEVVAHNGRYGPYVQCGKDTRSLPDDVSPLDVELDKALELLAQPKYKSARGGGAARKSTEPLKEFNESPVTGQPVKLLAGRFGNYVTDGVTNATLPKSVSIEELTFDRAIDLLAERAAKGPSKKRAVRKKAAPKKTAVKKTAKKTAKKTVKKTAGKKAVKTKS